MPGYGPIMVVPQCFTHVPDQTYSLRNQIEANSDFHTLEDPLGMPHGALFTGFYDFIESGVKSFWEAQDGD